LQTGEAPGPELVAGVLADAIEDSAIPFRNPVGEDAALIIGTRAQMNDADFETTMRATLGLSW
jgi:hypothetical protein